MTIKVYAQYTNKLVAEVETIEEARKMALVSAIWIAEEDLYDDGEWRSTGRTVITDSTLGGEIVDEVPDHDDWVEWTEYRNVHNELVQYKSDAGIVLDYDEFWAGEEA